MHIIPLMKLKKEVFGASEDLKQWKWRIKFIMLVGISVFQLESNKPQVAR